MLLNNIFYTFSLVHKSLYYMLTDVRSYKWDGLSVSDFCTSISIFILLCNCIKPRIFTLPGIPILAEGNIIGHINDQEIKSATFTADMIPLPDNSATHVNATITNVPKTVGKCRWPIKTLLEIIGYLFIYQLIKMLSSLFQKCSKTEAINQIFCIMEVALGNDWLEKTKFHGPGTILLKHLCLAYTYIQCEVLIIH